MDTQIRRDEESFLGIVLNNQDDHWRIKSLNRCAWQPFYSSKLTRHTHLTHRQVRRSFAFSCACWHLASSLVSEDSAFHHSR